VPKPLALECRSAALGVLAVRATTRTTLQPLLAAVLLAVAVGLSGCGGDQMAGASRDPRWVAAEFGMFYARGAANGDHRASEAEVAALARELATVCSPPRYGQYPCVVHVRGRIPSTQRCVAVVASSGQVTGRCSDGWVLAPVVTPGYVDCANIGRVVSIADPAGDEKRAVPLIASSRLVPTSEPRADLTGVRVAATQTRFCADFRTLAPLRQGSWAGLLLNRNGAPDLQFAPTISYRNSPTPELQSAVSSPIAGQVGTSGEWTSLVITAGDPAVPLPRAPFQFRAYVNYETAVPGAVRLTTDSAPDSPRYATYP
jgi:hypothetical protein